MKEWIIPHATGGFYDGKEVMFAVGPLLDGPLPNPGHTVVVEKSEYDKAQEELGQQGVEIMILKTIIKKAGTKMKSIQSVYGKYLSGQAYNDITNFINELNDYVD